MNDMHIKMLGEDISGDGKSKPFAAQISDVSQWAMSYSSLRSNPSTCSSDEAMELASQIFRQVLLLRSIGAIQNNPENLKTLDYFKARSQQLAEENEKLHKNLVNAYQVNEELQVRLGEKAKGSREVI
ncbi:MAG: hypothetical protein ACLP5V_04795 [Candidatus Bathyarchaeia archaeon]